MRREIALGSQDFAYLRENHCFYIDKTAFIREWWDGKDAVTLITRPRRFGKTITMSMLDYFFSNRHAGRSDLFEGLEVWREEEFRKLQGTYPVLFLSFAGIKEDTYEATRTRINQVISDVYRKFQWVKKQDFMTPNDRAFLEKVRDDMDDSVAAVTLQRLCGWLYEYFGKRCIILLDEYDTPMQEAYANGYWKELTTFIRSLFNNTFKTNPSMERAVLTGITRVSRESVFSDLNNLRVVTTTTEIYATAFGFTEAEVFSSMDEMEIPEAEKAEVKKWYDGFTFGAVTDIYNPWSVLNYLNEKKIDTYWANTSENGLVGQLLRRGDSARKMQFEELLRGGCIEVQLDEQIIFEQLDEDPDGIWSLLLAGGYLKYIEVMVGEESELPIYRLSLTNLEVKRSFVKMVKGWFKKTREFGEFVSAMLEGDVKNMNRYMNRVALNTFSYFDTGKKPSEDAPERFYHGFVLGLLVDHATDYIITSNRESGFGRYDVVLEPRDKANPAVIMEFKVYDMLDDETELSDTADHALLQIEEKGYAADLLYRGIPEQSIFKYGIAFQGQQCLIKKGEV
ncbi:MAG: AAA family ATPase [Lachnospiraceae bacterium]|nr:AAA family ATPase [Lachnospiraceae bacterium]